MNKKRFAVNYLVPVLLWIFCLIQIICCNDIKAEDTPETKVSPTVELLLGSWSRYNNRVYTLLIIRANGNWSSDLRVEGATSKIIERKGEATGTWSIEDNKLIMKVLTSEMEDVWAIGELTLEIVEIDNKVLTLKYPNSRIITWKKASVVKKEKKAEGEVVTTISPTITIKPIVVNLNKISSNDKDRYLCLALEVQLQEMDTTAIVPKLHPRALDAAILFLSSLMYNDVKTFDEMKVVTQKLTKILNPYFDGMVTDVILNHIMVSSSVDKVDEFIIEHSPPPVLENKAGEGADKGKEEEKKKEADKEKK
ncbi:MAG: flagellar basal body-associated FliL family protein [Desulfamplus sp.]|nr:flagellar basal body-associated FliL family protein [Desulfamplus sp.]